MCVWPAAYPIAMRSSPVVRTGNDPTNELRDESLACRHLAKGEVPFHFVSDYMLLSPARADDVDNVLDEKAFF
jgi:hypothetical protein